MTGAWAVYDILDHRFVDTTTWMGWMNTEYDPFVYNYTFEGWFYTPPGAVTTDGGWLYSYR